MSGVVTGGLPAGEITTVVADLDGVVYVDIQGVPGAAEALGIIEGAGIRILFATNNSTKTPELAARHIYERCGYVATPDQVITSSLAAADLLAGTVRSALVVGAEPIEIALAAVGIEPVEDWQDAEAVVAGLDRSLSYEILAAATQAVRRGGARLVATNTDATYPTPDGLLPGGGAIVAALERATGAVAEVAGKPHAPMRRLIERKAEGRILIVGDRPETDIALAGDGWRTALVLSGVTGRDDPIPPGLAPDVILRSIADVPGALGLG